MSAFAQYNEQTDAEDILQMQALLGPSQAEVQSNVQELRSGNLFARGVNFVGQVSVAGDYATCNNLEESVSGSPPVNGYGHAGGTGIRIRSRQPQPLTSGKSQGTAARRIRLQMNTRGSTANDKLRHTNQSHEEDEVQSTATGVGSLDEAILGILSICLLPNFDSVDRFLQVIKATEQSSTFDKQEKEHFMSNNRIGSTNGENPVNPSGDLAAGTGIKIRIRQPQPQASSNHFISPDSASRRIRLQINTAPQSIANDNLKGVDQKKEDEEEVQSTITKVRIIRKHDMSSLSSINFQIFTWWLK